MRRRDSLGVSFQTLKHYRVTGEGPAFHKFGGRVLYARFRPGGLVEGATPAGPDGRSLTAPAPSS